MSFRYKLHPKVVGIRTEPDPATADQKLLNETELSNVQTQNPPNTNGHGVPNVVTQDPSEFIRYPILALPKPSVRRGKKSSIVSVAGGVPTGVTVGPPSPGDHPEALDTPDGLPERAGEEAVSLKIKVELDFGRFFGWLERAMWLTMAIAIGWSLIIDYSKATREVCTVGETTEQKYPFNVLPSLSRTMSSFRVGTILWTVVIALAFVARLASNTFLHKLYESWFEPNLFNRIFLTISYYADNIEIISLLMIPAFSLDCDYAAHHFFFVLFLVLTYIAELMQYFTRYLRRNKGMIWSEDVDNYYRHIGVLILLQTFFIVWMFTGYMLHEYLCTHFLYSIFTFGEYATVVVNVRFKRDTVIFVK